MRPSEIALALETCLRARVPAYVIGPPGVGKSAVGHQVTAKLGRQLIDWRASQLDPVELRGLPYVIEGLTRYAPLGNLPRDGSGVLLLDELGDAPPMVQSALYQLILDRRLGEYVLPDGWDIVAAGNTQADKANAQRLSTALANRFWHGTFEVDLNEWCAWALGAGVPVEVVAFVRFRPETLHAFDPQSKERAFASPRSWEFVGKLFKAGVPAKIELGMYAGAVGNGVATEFVGFLQVYRELPSIDAILLNPDKAVVPAKPAVQYAVTGALARKATQGNMDRVVTYLKRLPAEFAVSGFRDASARDPLVMQTASAIKWMAENAAVMS